jgi:hypothetical protein
MTVMRFKMSPEEAGRILDDLCASTGLAREWWTNVAARFLELYEAPPCAIGSSCQNGGRATRVGGPLYDASGRPYCSERCRSLGQARSAPSPKAPTLGTAQLAIRDLLDAIKEFHPGDLLEGCTNVKQTYAGDYDCEGCRSCGLYYETVAAERMIERIDEVLDYERSRSRSDVPIGET